MEIIILLILPYPPLISMGLGERVRLVTRNNKKPVVAYVPRLERYRMIFEPLEEGNIPTADTIEQVIQMAYAIHQRSRAIARFEARYIEVPIDGGMAECETTPPNGEGSSPQ